VKNISIQACRLLLLVTRLSGAFVHLDGLGHSLQRSAGEVRTRREKRSTMLISAVFRMVFCRWSSALISQFASASFSDSHPLPCRGSRRATGVAAIDDQLWQGRLVQLDIPAVLYR
jgi:hypothetical protein